MTSTSFKNIINNKVVALLMLLIGAHVAHVFEEVWARFWILNKLGLGWFLIVNWLLLCIPAVLLFFVLNNKRWAYKISIVYAGIMGLQGILHNVLTLMTGRYYDGFAGGFTGIGLFIISLPLIYFLYREMPEG